MTYNICHMYVYVSSGLQINGLIDSDFSLSIWDGKTYRVSCLSIVGKLLLVHQDTSYISSEQRCKSNLNLIAVRSVSAVKELQCSTWFHMRRIRYALGFTWCCWVFCKLEIRCLKLAAASYLLFFLEEICLCKKQRHRK